MIGASQKGGVRRFFVRKRGNVGKGGTSRNGGWGVAVQKRIFYSNFKDDFNGEIEFFSRKLTKTKCL